MIGIPVIRSVTKPLLAILCLGALATLGVAGDSPGSNLRGSPEAAALQRDFPFLAKLLTAEKPWEQEPAELARTIFQRTRPTRRAVTR